MNNNIRLVLMGISGAFVGWGLRSLMPLASEASAIITALLGMAIAAALWLIMARPHEDDVR